MLRWLLRLLIIGLILFVATRVVSRMLGGDEDFDDYDDIDAGFEFTETPVEIDVPAGNGPSTQALSVASTPVATTSTPARPAATASTGSASKHRQALIDINGIGPTYASRLKEAGINTLDDLAKADPGSLAEKLDVIGGRATVENWIAQAQEMTSGHSRS
jgi:predicted flap endonuclease-1-like 5' DNA nuclease